MMLEIDIPASSPYSGAAVRNSFQSRGRGAVVFLKTAKTILTDTHFLVPMAVLLLGVILLVELH